jgi:hypothetical protein
VSSESQWSAPASDTSNVLNSTPLNALLSGNGGTAGFSINYEKVPQAITDLEHAAEFFHDRAKVAEGLAHIPAPGADGVSINAATQISKWAADSGENNLAATLHAGAKQLEDLARKLREDLKTYLQVEELNIPREPTPGLSL